MDGQTAWRDIELAIQQHPRLERWLAAPRSGPGREARITDIFASVFLKKIVAYVTQYDGWWSATLSQLQRLTEVAVSGKGYDLDKFLTPLKRKPSKVLHAKTSGRSQYIWTDTPVFRCTDYRGEDWQYALATVTPKWERTTKSNSKGELITIEQSSHHGAK